MPRPQRPKRPYIVDLDQVRITRQEQSAFIEYLDPAVGTVVVSVAEIPEPVTTDAILASHNQRLRDAETWQAANPYVAEEVPPGSPQIEYFAAGDQWTPRGGVLRCLISDGGSDYETTIWIDDQELSLHAFGRLLSTYNGWGMRICFVPDDAIDREPVIEAREPRR
jgi:hypothetical protein